ncbi:type II toxin-antitoxin system RelE/ParE family toxin [Benzoatithermus flavus]|uniref:Type II toxin-antitoxin system RelE/ParE family toxin n=1 Tax=Benzoatithermus flavus TaxID=3108223 RepID=A0ABU8XP55_9PROT
MTDEALHTAVETQAFLAHCKAAGVSEDERKIMVAFLAANSEAGDLIVGTGGARKVRFAGRGKGKSGGYRVITCFGGGAILVFLIALFSKGERSDLSQAERNELRVMLGQIEDAYRKRR